MIGILDTGYWQMLGGDVLSVPIYRQPLMTAMTGCLKTIEYFYLVVIVADGVDGTPEEGRYEFEFGSSEVVEYSYTLQEGYEELVVTVCGNTVAPSGTITMDTGYLLQVTASEIKNDASKRQ
ncbi:MAG: hypothetical protein GY757_39565 [bacterium]|nr:hypothetical protein [bacterium]